LSASHFYISADDEDFERDGYEKHKNVL
jgi:hypothetical protein